MKNVVLTTILALAGIFISHAHAQVIPLTIDSTQSFVDISLNGSSDTSSVSGSLTLDIQSSSPPSGNAQITAVNLVLDDSLSIVPVLGTSASTAPGDIVISLMSPGTLGTISGGSFDQLGNLLEVSGDINVSILFGGNQTIDLSTVPLSPVDFNSLSVTQSGNVITVGGSLVVNEVVEIGFFAFPFLVDANFVATGVVPPAVLLGDVDLDGDVDFADIPAFIAVLQAGTFQVEADIDQSGMVSFADIPLFIEVLMAQ